MDKPYLVRQWSPEKICHLHVFIGEINWKLLTSEISKLQDGKILSKESNTHFTEVLGLKLSELQPYDKIIFHKEWINDDDNMALVTKRLMISIKNLDGSVLRHPSELYIWSWRNVEQTTNLIYNFIYNLFGFSKDIRNTAFINAVKWHFGIEIDQTDNLYDISLLYPKKALNELYRLNIEKVIEPMSYRIVNEIYDVFTQYDPFDFDPQLAQHDEVGYILKQCSSMLIEEFELINNDFNLITYRDFMEKKILLTHFFQDYKDSNPDLSGGVKTLMRNIDQSNSMIFSERDISTFDQTENLNYMHLKFNKSNFNSRFDLGLIFNQLHCNPCIAMIKLKISQNIYYKIRKDFLPEIKKI